jgi:hypothetical protein
MNEVSISGTILKIRIMLVNKLNEWPYPQLTKAQPTSQGETGWLCQTQSAYTD